VCSSDLKNKKITEEDAQKIAQLDPSNENKFGKIYYDLLGGLIDDKMLVHNILSVKKRQKTLNEKFEDALADVKEMIENGSFIEKSEPVDLDLLQEENPEIYEKIMKFDSLDQDTFENTKNKLH
jgi:hypothetical protein